MSRHAIIIRESLDPEILEMIKDTGKFTYCPRCREFLDDNTCSEILNSKVPHASEYQEMISAECITCGVIWHLCRKEVCDSYDDPEAKPLVSLSISAYASCICAQNVFDGKYMEISHINLTLQVI